MTPVELLMTDTNQLGKPGSLKRTRREFLGSAAAGAVAAGGVAVAPRMARARNANDRLGIGLIGVGGRGQYHVRMLQSMIEAGENIRIVAVCDAYGPRMRSSAERVRAKSYMHHQDLLADREVDVVCIASPDRLHVPQAIDAIRAGKDVYCEKPMGHWSQYELSRHFLEETRKLNRVVQIGNQGNSSSFWPRIREMIQKGAIGKPQHVLAGYYRYGDWGERMPIPDKEAQPGPDLDWEAFLGDAPKVPFSIERFFSWRMFLDYAGGPCTDLFPHVYTPILSTLSLETPSLVSTSGGIFKYDDYGREVPDTFNMCLDFPQKLSVVLVCTLANDYMTEPTVIAGEKPNSTVAHWKNFLQCVRTREKPVSDVEFGCNVQAALCMGMLSYLQKKTARFDTTRQEIILN
jgi:predicted dehydrogenase